MIRHHQRWAMAIGIATASLWSDRAAAQAADVAVDRLPRPGYEPRTIRLGATTIAPTLNVAATYNDNIIATPDRRIDDVIFNIRPRIDVSRPGSTLDLSANVHADLFRYAAHPQENVETFGAGLTATRRTGPGQTIQAEAGFDRSFQRRSDPEADFDRTRPPALINIATGDLRYTIRGAQVGLAARFTVTDLDWLSRADADRDLATYRGSLRLLHPIGPGIAAYVEGFALRRDNRLAIDRGGFDRDATTAGGLAGLEFSLTGKLTGELGLGVFHADPDDARLNGFTGVAASGRVAWRPRQRTEVMLDLFRGDVASVRVGAIGRVDTRAGLSVEQEARHNLVLHGSVQLRDVHYRGTIDRDQRYRIGEAELRYLVNRNLSLTLGTTYTRRGADFPGDRFHTWQASAGLRAAY